jgi:hypothetical protein
MVLPNPFRLGTETGGPLVSCHSNKKVPSPFARFTSHVIETRPPRTDNAPYSDHQARLRRISVLESSTWAWLRPPMQKLERARSSITVPRERWILP